ncbi:GntR family transcriptional regulator [Streptomyces sp. NPDC005227]|uniref:GntR family transcriptional regulator n=1 Tax=Streptomyces sp. NPDC005227 TaxID=3364707 RepID=UPI0036A0D083
MPHPPSPELSPPLPPIRRIAEDLRRRIAAAEFEPGDRLPSTRELSEQYEVDPKTVYRAVSLLKESGYLISRQGAGVYVRTSRAAILREPQARYAWEKERARLPLTERRQTGTGEYDTGRQRQDFDFPAEYSQVEATEDLARRMEIPVGTHLLERLYRTTIKDEQHPLALISSYLPYDLAARNPDLLDEGQEPWPGGTMNQLFTVGIEIDRIVDEVSARPPTLEETDLLQVGSGVPVVVLHKTSYSTEDLVVEYSQVIFPGDRTTMKYTINLDRWLP